MNKREMLLEGAVLFVLILIGVFGPMIPFSAVQVILGKMPQIFIISIAALGLNIIMGYCGMFHFGLAAFVGIGAYTLGILTFRNYPFGLGFWPLLIIGPCVTMVAGVCLGIPLMRVKGDYLAIVSLGFGEIVKDCMVNLSVITNGSQGLNPVPVPNFPESFGISFSDTIRPWYFFTLIILFVCIRFCRQLSNSRFGRAWRAIRDDELAAGCIGLEQINVKLNALAVGCMLAGLSGVLYASKLETTAEPKTYDFNFSAMLIAMVILGGIGSVYGTVAGVCILYMFEIFSPMASEYIQSNFPTIADKYVFLDPNFWKLATFGLALVIMTRYKPKGIIPEEVESSK